MTDYKVIKYWKGFALILVALNILLLCILVIKPFTRPEHPNDRPREEGPAKFIIEKLKFTPQQEVDFTKLKLQHQAAVRKLRNEGRLLRESFFEGLEKDSISSDKDRIAQRIAENQKQLELVTYDHFEQVKKICSPEQKLIFNDIIGEVLQQMAPHPMHKPGDERP